MSSKSTERDGKYLDSGDEEMSEDDYSYDDFIDKGISEGKKSDKGRGLSVNVSSSVEAPSFDVTESLFIKGDIAINKASVQKRHSEKMFVVDPSELVKGPIIGRGASSYVQKATHSPTGTDLALKVVNVYDKGTRDQMMREIECLYDASCPSLVRFFGAFYRDGTISIALEYMDGGSLANLVHQVGAVREPVLAYIAYQVCYGLQYMKQVLKRVHRDLKPSNVLINSQGIVKLTDFGLARAMGDSQAMCATFVGTYKYMSPERIVNKEYGFASDIWSLGLTLIECATAGYPYEKDPESCTYIEMVQTILESDPPSLPDGFSNEFHTFIAHCVKKEPEKRLPANILIGSPWMRQHGATSLEFAIGGLRSWIVSLQQ